jgi:hypothetical protein
LVPVLARDDLDVYGGLPTRGIAIIQPAVRQVAIRFGSAHTGLAAQVFVTEKPHKASPVLLQDPQGGLYDEKVMDALVGSRPTSRGRRAMTRCGMDSPERIRTGRGQCHKLDLPRRRQQLGPEDALRDQQP